MTVWFLIGLGVAWAAVFVPAALRARETAPLSAAKRFKHGLDLIAPGHVLRGGGGRWVIVPHAANELRTRRYRAAIRRRRRILESLGVVTGASVLPALLVGGFFSALFMVSATCLSLFVALLLGTKRQRAEAARKVRHIDALRPDPVEDVVFNDPVVVGGSGH